MKVLGLGVALVAVALLCGNAHAQMDATGTDPGIQHEFGTREQVPCAMMFYGDPMGERTRFQGLGYTVTIDYDLSYGNLQNYDVLYIAITGPGTIGAYQTDIEQFVSDGGGLWIHQPSTPGTIDYAPTGFDFYVADTWWCEPYDLNVITDPGHPTMNGLTDPDLPGRFDTVHLDDLGPGYTSICATGGGACTGDMHCAAGEFGEGRVFADVSNLSSGSGDPGSDQYVVNVGDWLCSGEPVPVQEKTWGRVKSIYR